MTRRLLKIYSQMLAKPYRLALHYFDIERNREVVELFRYSTYKEIVLGTLSVLADEDSGFMDRAAANDDARFMNSKHKERRYISEQRELVYIGSPHLTDQFTEKIKNHWVCTNIGRSESFAILAIAAAAMHVKRLPLSELKLH